MEFLMGILCIKSFGAAFFPRSRSSQVDKRGQRRSLAFTLALVASTEEAGAEANRKRE